MLKKLAICKLAGFFVLIPAFFLLLAGQSRAADPAWAASFEIGKPVPDFSLPDMNGDQVSLAPFFGKKVIALVFWTTWSDKCHDELAYLEKLYQKNKDDLVVLAVNLDKEGIDKACLYADQWAVSFPILADEKLTTLEQFQVLVIPTVFLICRGGLLCDIQVDYDQDTPDSLTKKIEELLAKDLSEVRSGSASPPDRSAAPQP